LGFRRCLLVGEQAGQSHANIQVSMVDAPNLDLEVLPLNLKSASTEPGHAVNHAPSSTLIEFIA
jgi:hypothetical protein